MESHEWKIILKYTFSRMKNLECLLFLYTWLINIRSVEGLDRLKLNFSEKVWRFHSLGELTFHPPDQGFLTSSLWYILICIIVIVVGRMSFLVMLSVSISKTEKSMTKIVLNMLSLPNESCSDFPILSSRELYLSFILCQEKLSFKGNFCSYAGIFLLFMFFLFPYGNLSQRVSVQLIHA